MRRRDLCSTRAVLISSRARNSAELLPNPCSDIISNLASLRIKLKIRICIPGRMHLGVIPQSEEGYKRSGAVLNLSMLACMYPATTPALLHVSFPGIPVGGSNKGGGRRSDQSEA